MKSLTKSFRRAIRKHPPVFPPHCPFLPPHCNPKLMAIAGEFCPPPPDFESPNAPGRAARAVSVRSLFSLRRLDILPGILDRKLTPLTAVSPAEQKLLMVEVRGGTLQHDWLATCANVGVMIEYKGTHHTMRKPKTIS